jgi:hypothetical protein
MSNRRRVRLCLEELERRLTPSTIVNSTSTNWSGYAVSAGSGTSSGPAASNGVSLVQASWTVPTAKSSSTTTYSAAWVGIDGYNSSTVEQIGTDSDYIAGKGGGPQYYAWIELYPNDYWVWSLPGTTNGAVPPMKAGDTINAQVSYQVVNGAGQFSLSLNDITAGYNYQAIFTYSTPFNGNGELVSNQGTLAFSLNGNSATAYDPFLSSSAVGGAQHPVTSAIEGLSAAYTLNSRTGTVNKWITNSDGTYAPVDRSSADWIQESPGTTVTNFSPLTFSGAQATIGGVTGPISSSWPSGYSIYHITLVSQRNSPEDTVSALSNSGSSFTITYGTSAGKNGPAGPHSQFVADSTDASSVARQTSSVVVASLGISSATTTGSTVHVNVVQVSPSAYLDVLPSRGPSRVGNDSPHGDGASELQPDPAPIAMASMQMTPPAIPEDATQAFELGSLPALDAYFADQAGTDVASAAAPGIVWESDAQLDGLLADPSDGDE